MIYISLTTVPKRLRNWDIANKNIMSLLSQDTVNEYKVIFNIPPIYRVTGEEYIIPDGLSELAKNNDKLIINRDCEDIGPILKVVGAFKYATNPSDNIIALDDDHVYHNNMIQYYIWYSNLRMSDPTNAATLQDKKCVFCFRGDMPVEKRVWQEGEGYRYMLKPTHLYFPVLQERQLIIPGHWHSVFYQRSMFEDDFMDIIGKGNNDDILVGYYMKKKGISVKCIPYAEEEDGRPVNDNGRPCFSFPIVDNLPTEDSGFNEFRKKAGDGYGSTDAELLNYIHNNDIIF